MFIFRAVNIYPSQIDAILSQVPGVSSEYNVVLESESGGRDRMIVRVERDAAGHSAQDDALAAEISGRIKAQILVTADVEVLDYGSLARSERKSKRLYDHR
jgi:phenylacetate-CoA ligase